MLPEDIEHVLEIEKKSFPFPWTKQQFHDEFNKAHSIQLVYESDKQIYGYVIAWYITGELEIGIIATDQNKRKSGVASGLLNHLFRETKPTDCFLEVSIINTSAIEFYKHHKFQIISTRKNYYRDGSDAIIMKLTF